MVTCAPLCNARCDARLRGACAPATVTALLSKNPCRRHPQPPRGPQDARLRALDERDLALPVHALRRLLRPRGRAVDHRVDAHLARARAGRKVRRVRHGTDLLHRHQSLTSAAPAGPPSGLDRSRPEGVCVLQPPCCWVQRRGAPVGGGCQLRRSRPRTRAAGSEVRSLRSACTVVAPQSRRKSAGFCRGRTMQRTCPPPRARWYVARVVGKQRSLLPAAPHLVALVQAQPHYLPPCAVQAPRESSCAVRQPTGSSSWSA